jgi:putative acetyltransferase
VCDNARECEAARLQGFGVERASTRPDAVEPIGADEMGSGSGVRIRPAEPGDETAILGIHRAAFETDAEAELVEALLASGDGVISLVALENAVVVGHVLLSRVTVGDDARAKMVSLAPVAVRPEFQCRGVGSRLVRASVDVAREQGWDAVVVLGHAAFYPRFGFVPATPLGILPPWPDIPEDAWMVAELSDGVLDGLAGVVSFPPPFDAAV